MIGNPMHRLRSFLSAMKPTRLGVLFAVLIGFGVGFWQWNRPPRPRVVLKEDREILRTFFSPNGKDVVTVEMFQGNLEGGSYSLTLWDAKTGVKQFDLPKARRSAFAGVVRPAPNVVFSPDGQNVAWFSEEDINDVERKEFHIWDISGRKELAVIRELPFEVRPWNDGPFLFSQTGRLIIRRANRLWDVANHKIVKTLLLEGEEIIASGENTVLVRCQPGVIKLWNLPTATVSEYRNIGELLGDLGGQRVWVSDRFFFANAPLGDRLLVDLVTGQKMGLPGVAPVLAASADGKIIAWHDLIQLPQAIPPPLPTKSWWTQFTEWLGIHYDNPSGKVLKLQEFPSGREIVELRECEWPTFSPEGRTLAVKSTDGSLQLWDLPIRTPIGKILGLAGLAALATLLAFKGLGRLRRRRCSPTTSVETVATATSGQAETGEG